MSRHISVILAASSLLLLGSGCGKIASAPVDALSNATNIVKQASSTLDAISEKDRPFAWKDVSMGIKRGEQTMYRDGWKERTIIYRFDPLHYSFNLVSSEKKKTIRAWRDDLPEALLVMNGVYFHDDGTPVGSLRINGKELSKTKFDADKSGIFEFDGSPSIIDTASTASLIQSFSVSAQSYPFLIKNGDSSVATDSQMLARRSFIGIDNDGFMYLGAFPDGEISLFEMSKQLKALPIQWKHVLNLDGGPSTSFLSRIKGSEEIEDGYSAIPNVITVQAK